MPVARSHVLKGGWSGFIWRRGRRILPPYYAAVAFALAVILLVPGMDAPQGLRWDRTLPAITRGPLLSHLLLLQDLKPEWMSKVNHTMWTIAQEWQIYFFFAFLLLPIWRYAGILAAVLVSFLLSVAFRYLGFGFARPDFLFLFGVGMFAAVISFPGPSAWLLFLRDRLPWGWLMIVLWLAYLAAMIVDAEPRHALGVAVLVGAAMLCTLASCTNASRDRQGSNLALQVCELDACVVVGTFSYSLYLVHAPVLSLFTLGLHHWHVRGWWAPAIEALIAVPVATAFAYGFHLVAERPFMLGTPENLKRAEKAAILDTAP
jgi:peptidoglycan/LPS O-acetylase OafA/YrhL